MFAGFLDLVSYCCFSFRVKRKPPLFSPLELTLWLFGLLSFLILTTYTLFEFNENLFCCHFNVLPTIYYYFILFGHQRGPNVILYKSGFGIFL